LFQKTVDGHISNLYTFKVVNKTSRDIPVELRVENFEGGITVLEGATLVVPRERLVQGTALVRIDPAKLKGPTTHFRIGVYSGGRRLNTVETVFVGLRE
jgi:hypothetical protein